MKHSGRGRWAARVAAALQLHSRDVWRGLRGSPGFAISALLLLTFGLGLNTAIFSVVNAVLLRPLPVTAPEQLAFVWRADGRGNEHDLGPYADVGRFVGTSGLFTAGAGVERDTAILRDGKQVEELTGERVSANYFEVLGVVPQLGRSLLSMGAEAPDVERTVVISDALWRRRFGGELSVIGQSLALSTTTYLSESAPRYTIIGVLGPEFTGVSNPLSPADYWVPYVQRESDVFGLLKTRTPKIGMLVGRMKPGVTLEGVQASANVAFASSTSMTVYQTDRGAGAPIVRSSPVAKLPFGRGAIAPSRLGAGLLLLTTLVLVIATVNLCGLVLTRRIAQGRNVAIRMSLGATRGQVSRQLLVEMFFLSCVGAGLGLVVARVFVPLLLTGMGNGFGGTYAQLSAVVIPIDLRVLTFTAAALVFTVSIAGLASVRRLRAVNVVTELVGESLSAPSSAGSQRLRWVLVPQLTVSLALVLLALVALRAYVDIAVVASGYEPHRTGYVTFERLFHTSYATMSAEQKRVYLERVSSFPRRLIALASTHPGIDAAAITTALPTNPARSDVTTRDGRELRSTHTETAAVTPAYFSALGIPLVQGRIFDDGEVANGHAVAVVDEELANRLWPGESAIGKGIAAHVGVDLSTQRWYEVVGIVGAVRGPLSEGERYAFAYLPWPQAPMADQILIARGRSSDLELLATLRGIAERADSGIGVLKARMVGDLVDERRYTRRVAAELLGFCAIGAVALAASGVYCVLSYVVAQRRRDLGIRAALGAGQADLVRLVVKEGVVIAALGAAFGVPLAVVGTRIASHYLVPIPTPGVMTFIAATVVATAVAILACYLPARRASLVDPLDVLRRA